MNVFEDLVIELQAENLLEKPVIEGSRDRRDEAFDIEVTETPDRPTVKPPSTDVEIETAADFSAASTVAPTRYLPQNQRQQNDKEFFKKRATSEVSSLQIVEHVLTGVEREYLKVLPKTYDDFKVKKVLNNFLQIPGSVNSEEHAQAEFLLLRETESWCSALAERDKNVPVSALRQFCENTKPALSSQAMLAAARFYRNLPYSETVRSKFDFVITRLFSRLNENNHRVALFNREEILDHIKTLYAEWSSVPLYATNDDDSDVVMAILSFDDLANESEKAASFDQLIQSDFFIRLRSFKESISELFFAPRVTAAAIDANVRIGNSYVRLISRERKKMDVASIQTKFGGIDDSIVSDATARTLELGGVLKAPMAPVEERQDETEPQNEPGSRLDRENTVEKQAEPEIKKAPNQPLSRFKEQIMGFNRWILIGCGILVLATVCLVVWANYFAQPPASTAGVTEIDFSDSTFAEYLQKAKVSNSMLYAQMKDSWSTLPKEKRLELLKVIYDGGATRGYTQVNLIDGGGKPLGYASPTRLEVPAS